MVPGQVYLLEYKGSMIAFDSPVEASAHAMENELYPFTIHICSYITDTNEKKG